MHTTTTNWLNCGALLLFLTAAPAAAHAQAASGKSTQAATQHAAADALAGTEWELTEPEYAGLEEKPFVKFADQQLNASVGLNIIGGTYKLDGAKITISQLRSTRMAGPPQVMQAESRYIKALEGIKSYELSADGKTLTLRGEQTLRFRRTKLPAASDADAAKDFCDAHR